MFVHIGSDPAVGPMGMRQRIRMQSLQLMYIDNGVLQFDSTKVSGIFPVLPEYHYFDIGLNWALMHQVYTDQAMVIRKAAKVLSAVDDISVSETDAIAYRMWMDRDSQDAYEVDAMAWLCKVIAKSKNPRYRDLLKSISAEA